MTAETLALVAIMIGCGMFGGIVVALMLELAKIRSFERTEPRRVVPYKGPTMGEDMVPLTEFRPVPYPKERMAHHLVANDLVLKPPKVGEQ